MIQWRGRNKLLDCRTTRRRNTQQEVLERGKTVGQSEFDQVRGRMNAKLPCDICLVKFHRLDGYMELLGNLLCRPTLR